MGIERESDKEASEGILRASQWYAHLDRLV